MSTAMSLLQAVSCGLIAGGLALIPDWPRHILVRGLIASPLAFALSFTVSVVAS